MSDVNNQIQDSNPQVPIVITDPKNDPKPNRWDFLKVNSEWSSMRLAFMRIINVCLICLPVTIVAYFVADWFGHHIDISPIIMLIASVLVPAIGGKAVQSFSENRGTNGSSSFSIGGSPTSGMSSYSPYGASTSPFGTPPATYSTTPAPNQSAVLNAGNANVTPINIGR